jgi:hypothetical protein
VIRIVSLYDMLRAQSPSPVVDVNRALAVAMCRGALAGLDAIPERDLVAPYPYALATYAELHASLGHLDQARTFLDRALEQRMSPAERPPPPQARRPPRRRRGLKRPRPSPPRAMMGEQGHLCRQVEGECTIAIKRPLE